MDSPPAREPLFNAPTTTLALVALILAAHGLRVAFLSDESDLQFVLDWGFIPLRLPLFWSPEATTEDLRRLVEAGQSLPAGSMGRIRAAIAAYVLDDGSARLQTLVTHAGLHGGWAHAIVNALWLVAFGGAVDRRFGAVRFLLLGLVCAVGGALAHMALDPQSPLPLIGASGAVSGYTGAMARFAFATGGPLGRWRADGDDAFRYPAPPLLEFMRNGRALTFVGLWFLLNFISGVASGPLVDSDAPIAWVAHVGGFASGFLLFGLFDPIGRLPGATLR
jgi:membrane associated rhomboid family serine protease